MNSNDWIDLIEFPKLYEINKNIGVRFKNGNGIILALSKERYPRVCMTINEKAVKRAYHRLLAQHYIPNPNNLKCVNHIDGNTKNFKLSNLEWSTHSANTRHADQTGLRSSKRSGRTVEELNKDREVIIVYDSAENAAKSLGIPRTTFIDKMTNTGVLSFNNRFFRYKIPEVIIGELWQPFNTDIKEINEKYSISNMGRVKINKTGRYKKTVLGTDERDHICISTKEKSYNFILSRIVAYGFNRNANKKHQVNHINKNVHDNKLSNLEILDAREHNLRDHAKAIIGMGEDIDDIIIYRSEACYMREHNLKSSAGIGSSMKRGIRCRGYTWDYLGKPHIKDFLNVLGLIVIEDDYGKLSLEKPAQTEESS